MERITLSNLHEHIDSLKSTSIPQVKKYFRKRIVKCINECKTQALNMKKSIEQNGGSSQAKPLDPNDYEFGWGSDFDEDDDDEEEGEEEEDGKVDNRLKEETYSCDNKNNSEMTSVQSLGNLHLHGTSTEHIKSTHSTSRLHSGHSLSLQSFDCFDHSVGRSSSKGSCCWSSPSASIRRPSHEPPPPPLPREPPPNVIEENNIRIINGQNRRNGSKGIQEDTYESMTPSSNNWDDEYLLPNSAIKSSNECTYLGIESPEEKYEYIQYNRRQDSRSSRTTTSSSESSSHLSASRNYLKIDCDVLCERPLPPIPKEENIEDLVITSFSWFHDLERAEAESLLKRISTDGVYLVRKSRRAGASSPFTLTLYHEGRIFHLNIRKREDNRYALGKEKHKEKTFATVAELVENHNSEPIFLTSKGQAAGKTRLIYTPTCVPVHK